MSGEFSPLLDPIKVFEDQQLRIEALMEENDLLRKALDLRNQFLAMVR